MQFNRMKMDNGSKMLEKCIYKSGNCWEVEVSLYTDLTTSKQNVEYLGTYQFENEDKAWEFFTSDSDGND